MKKLNLTLLLLIAGINLYSIEFTLKESGTFNFYTDSSNDKIIEKIEDINNNLNRILKLESSSVKRSIYIISNKKVYDQYISELGLDPREDFVYITYNRPENNRLIIYINNDNLDRSLKYHITLQYIHHAQNSVPKWYQQGLASYFEDDGIYNESKKEDKYWSSFYFLFNANEDIRVLWDSLSYIRWMSDDFNPGYIEDLFTNSSIFAKALNYTKEYVSYDDRVAKAITLYNEKMFNKARTSFLDLIKENKEDPITYYYLGLCLSNLKMYNDAYSNFSKAIDLGSDKDLTYYSIAVNFYNSGNDKSAIKYLEKINPETNIYNKSQELLITIKR